MREMWYGMFLGNAVSSDDRAQPCGLRSQVQVLHGFFVFAAQSFLIFISRSSSLTASYSPEIVCAENENGVSNDANRDYNA